MRGSSGGNLVEGCIASVHLRCLSICTNPNVSAPSQLNRESTIPSPCVGVPSIHLTAPMHPSRSRTGPFHPRSRPVSIQCSQARFRPILVDDRGATSHSAGLTDPTPSRSLPSDPLFISAGKDYRTGGVDARHLQIPSFWAPRSDFVRVRVYYSQFRFAWPSDYTTM